MGHHYEQAKKRREAYAALFDKFAEEDTIRNLPIEAFAGEYVNLSFGVESDDYDGSVNLTGAGNPPGDPG